MEIEMSDYPILLAKLRQYFPKLIVQSYEPSNAHSDVGKVSFEVSKVNSDVVKANYNKKDFFLVI